MEKSFIGMRESMKKFMNEMRYRQPVRIRFLSAMGAEILIGL